MSFGLDEKQPVKLIVSNDNIVHIATREHFIIVLLFVYTNYVLGLFTYILLYIDLFVLLSTYIRT